MNCVAWLADRAAATPHGVAVIDDATGAALTYAQLHARSNAIASGLAAEGFARGERVLLLVRAGIPLITLTYAMFKAGVVPVLIDPGMGRAGFLACVAQLGPTGFVGIPLGHAVRLFFPRAFRSVRRHVTVGTRWFWGGPTLDGLASRHADAPAVCVDAAEEDEAAVLFTSGSTGPAKGVVYTHGIFNAQIRALRDTYGFREGEVDCAAFPLFSLFDNALGMTSVIPEVDASRPGRCKPELVARALTRHKCTTAFGSPAIWRRVAPWATATGTRFPHLERILIAGASVPPALVAELHRAFDGEVYTPYGATESLPVANIDGRTIVARTGPKTATGAGTCVGRPVGGVELRVIVVDDGPLDAATPVPDGDVGELAVRGPVVTRSYAALPEATEKAKIVEADGTVWHRMGDLGYVDPEGDVWFVGRKSERIETRTTVHYPDPIEGVANALAGRRTAAVGPGVRGMQRVALVVEGEPDDALGARLREALPMVEAVFWRPELPVDPRHNAKINRMQLAASVADRMPAQVLLLAQERR